MNDISAEPLPVTQADRDAYAAYVRRINGTATDDHWIGRLLVGQFDTMHGPQIAATARLATRAPSREAVARVVRDCCWVEAGLPPAIRGIEDAADAILLLWSQNHG